MTTQYSNQFNITNIVGALTLLQNNNILSGLVDANESGTLVPGNAVLMKDVASKIPKFELATAKTDDIFGFIPSDIRTSEYVLNEPIKVAFNDCVMLMEASAAIAGGADLQYDPATNKVATRVAPNTTIGKCLDKAAADGDMVRVLIKTPGNVDQDLSGLTASVAELNILDGVTATAAELNYNDLTTGPGTQEASKAVVADANVNTGISKVTELHIGASGSEVQLNATPAELNAVADKSASIINTTAASLALTAALHAERLVTVDKADGAALTLPAAAGTGNKYTVILGTTITSNSSTIKAANASDSFFGLALGVDTDGEGATGYTWNADSGDDTVTMTGTTNGGVAGDTFTFVDFAANKWLVEGRITQSGGSEVTPFSATVS
jgi:hypothetical protein